MTPQRQQNNKNACNVMMCARRAGRQSSDVLLCSLKRVNMRGAISAEETWGVKVRRRELRAYHTHAACGVKVQTLLRAHGACSCLG